MKTRFLGTTVCVLAATTLYGLAAAPVAVPLSSRTPLDFANLKERPLFSPQRAAPAVNLFPAPVPELPPSPPVDTAAAPPVRPEWELVGLVRSSRVNRAIFRDPADSSSFVLELGEQRQGWTLNEIQSFAVLFGNGTQNVEITFPRNRSAAAASSASTVDSGGPSTSLPQPSPVTELVKPLPDASPDGPLGSLSGGPLGESFSPAQQQ